MYKKLVSAAVIGAIALSIAPISLSAASASSHNRGEEAPIRYNADGSVMCIETGYRNIPLDKNGIAPGPFCFNAEDKEGLATPRIAPVNSKLTLSDLHKVENTSVLSPTNYQGKDTFAYKKLTGNEPIDEQSTEAMRQVIQMNDGKPWLTAHNVGWGVGGNENIPVLSTDSSNPNQEWIEVVSTDSRVINNSTNAHFMTGPVPMPSWYLKKMGQSGDKAVMIYDKATGVSRSMFYLQKLEDKKTYSSSARFVVGNGTPGVLPIDKINYGEVVKIAADGKAFTSAIPTSNNTRSAPVEKMEIPRSATFKLGKNAPAGSSVNAKTGVVTLTAKAGSLANGAVVDVPVEVSYPEIWNFASGGYITGEKDFQGLGDDNYWLNLRSGTSSVVGLQNELTQIGVDELRAGKINHAISMTWNDYAKISSFPAKMADGSVSLDKNPHALHAGQRFTFPADFNVQKWVDQNRPGDTVMAMVLTAAQEYGVIITDRNLFISAFNFESPAGYAPYARDGKNVYTDDPQIKALMDNFFPYSFPILEAEVIEKDFAEIPGDTAVKQIKTTDFVYRAEGKEVYQPVSYNTSAYAGETPYLNENAIKSGLSSDLAYHANQPVTVANEGYKTVHIGHKWNSPTDFVGTKSQILRSDWFRITNSGDKEAQKTYYAKWNEKLTYDGNILYHHPLHGDAKYEDVRYKRVPGDPQGLKFSQIELNFQTVARDKPIAREDTGWVVAGSNAKFDVLRNDESSFDAKNKADAPTMSKVILLDPKTGKETKSYSDSFGTYSVIAGDNGREQINVKANKTQGYTPLVKYVAVTSAGVKSAPGVLQPKVTLQGAPTFIAPVATADAVTTVFGKAITVDVLANDSIKTVGATWASLKLKSANASGVQTNSAGTYKVTNNKIVFTPNAGYSGKAPAVQYIATDSYGDTATGNLTVTVAKQIIVKAPLVTNDVATTPFGKAITVNVLANDKVQTTDGTWKAVKLKGANAAGAVVNGAGTYKVDANKKVVFTPKAGYSGKAPAVEYTATDSSNASANGSITVTVSAATAPTAAENKVTTPFGKAVTVDVLANDKLTQAGATWKSVKLVKADKNGAVVNGAGTYKVDANKKVVFTPKAGYSGVAPIVEYTATDSNNKSVTSKVKITVAAKIMVAPTVVADTGSTVTNKAVVVNLLANDKLNEKNAKWTKVHLAGMDSKGKLVTKQGTYVIDASMKLTFTPAKNWEGTTTPVTYTALDSNGKKASSTVTIKVGASSKPTAVSNTATTKVNKAVKVNVLANDKITQAGATWGAVTLKGANTAGKLTTPQGVYQVNSDKTVTFTPLKGFVGKPAAVSYTVTDSNGKSATSTLQITVTK